MDAASTGSMRRRQGFSAGWIANAGMLTFSVILVTACGQMAGAKCTGNVATVGSTQITRVRYRELLRYVLDFYERANVASPYYRQQICGEPRFRIQCRSVRRDLLQRMIDQQIVSRYAAAHNLVPTASDWNRALQEEQRVVRRAGGESGFSQYLAKLGTDQAQFRWFESQQIETAKVMKAMGTTQFSRWLRRQESAKSVIRCPGETGARA